MQQEVLRDLPVVVIPEPLPWSTRPLSAEPIAPAPEPAVPIVPPVQSQPTATVTYTPSPQPESVQPEPVSPWPHFEPVVEEAHARPTARRSKRARGRPLLLIGIAAALVAAAHFTMTATRSLSADSSDGEESEEELLTEPVGADAATEEPAVKVTPAPGAAAAPRVTSAPARVPMTPGQAFAASAPVPPGADTIAPRARTPVAPATPTKAEPAETAPSLAPAPVELDLALPDLQTDSIATARRSDTTAMKKILRALNGSKP